MIYRGKPKQSTKIRILERKNLPYGKFNYIVFFNISRKCIVSSIYDVSLGQKQIRKIKTNKNTNTIKNPKSRILNIDELEGCLETFSTGLYRLSVNTTKYNPIKIYFTKEDDILGLFFYYKELIKKIYKIKPISN